MKVFVRYSSIVALLIIAGLPAQQSVWAEGEPVIQHIIPRAAATGFGQLMVMQGHVLPTANEARIYIFQKGKFSPAFVFESPSNENELYFRPDFDLEDGLAWVILTDHITGLSSSPFLVFLQSTPAAPIPRRMCDSELPGCPDIDSAAPGDTIGVQAMGTDTSGAFAIFSQATTVVEVLSVCAVSNPSIGLVNEFVVPYELEPGPALVQLRVQVDDVFSPLSFGLRLTITE